MERLLVLVVIAAVGSTWFAVCALGIRDGERVTYGGDDLGIGAASNTLALLLGALLTVWALLVVAFG